MPGEVRSVRARLSLEVAQAIAGADRFGASMERNAARAERAGARVDRSSARTGRAWDMVGRGARNTFLVGAAGLAVMERANYTFDKSMGTVNAATHANAKVMDEYRQAAIKAGADTVFSASEAAQGITELAKAGVSAKDILGGGLTGALNLAAAGGLGVGQSAEYMATALTQFQLKGDKATHVADLLAAGAGKAQGEVSDMALALTYAGVPSNQLGVSLEQTAGTIALFAKNGIIGERAGTSIRGMLASLTSPSAVAGKEMKRLGISVFDAKGNFVGFDGVAKVLHQRLGGLTQQERSYALGRIFGNEQLQAANVLYREGAKGVHTWTKNVDDSGYAADTAKRKLNNLAGDVEYLKGDIDALFIKRGGGAQDGLRDLVQGVDRAVVAFGHLPDEVQSGVVKVTALTTATAGLLYVASKVVKTYRGVRDVFGATKAGSGLGAVAGAAASKSVVPVYVTNWAGGSLPGAKGAPGTAPVPVGGKTGGSKLARAGGLIVDAAVVLASANAISSLGEAIGKLGDRGREAGVLDQFTKPKSGLNALLFGGGHTIKHDANAALHADSVGGKADKFLAGLVGGDGFTKSLGNIKKLDAALADLEHKHPDKAADAYQAVLKKTGLTAGQLNKILPKTADAMGLVSKATEHAQKAQLDANGKLKAGAQLYGAGGVNVSKYVDELQLLPGAVQKAVLAEKATTQGQIDSLARRFDLTPIQVKALVTLAGGKEAISEAHRTALKIAHELDMTRPDKADRPKTPQAGPIKGGVQPLLLTPVLNVKAYGAVIAKHKAELRNLPAGVMTKISTPGAIQSLSQVRALGRQYGLTPKQVRTVARLVNAALVRAGLGGLIGLANTLDKKRPKPKVSVDTSKARAQLNSFATYLAGALRPRTVQVGVHTGNVGPLPGLIKPAAGTTVPGSRHPYRDSVHALLAPTEEVVSNDRGQADRYRPVLKGINANLPPSAIKAMLARGGTVAGMAGGGTAAYNPGSGVTVYFPAPDTLTAAVKAADQIAAAGAKYAASAQEVRAVRLDDLHLSQQIRDTQKSLAERNTKMVGKGKHRHKVKTGYTLSGIDRTTAAAELADLKAQQREARAQNAIAKATADARADAIQAIQDARKDATTTLTGASDPFARGAGAGAVLSQVNRDTRDIAQYGQNIAALKNKGASAALLNLVKSKADAGDFYSANRLAKTILESPTLLGQFNTALGARDSTAGAVANITTDPRFLASGAWNPTSLAPSVSSVVMLQADPSTWMTELVARVEHAVTSKLTAKG